jgi:transcriptional regulator GlxA family with amidase domain
MTYLREVRLTRAHDELQRAEPGEVSVAEVAARWGFTHLGRFGVTYRSKFGVAPSRTLRDDRAF